MAVRSLIQIGADDNALSAPDLQPEETGGGHVPNLGDRPRFGQAPMHFIKVNIHFMIASLLFKVDFECVQYTIRRVAINQYHN